MLVHEARARFEGRAPKFGNAEDREAVVLLSLYHQAAAKARLSHTTVHRLAKKLQDFEQSDAATLEAYLHPSLARRERSQRGC